MYNFSKYLVAFLSSFLFAHALQAQYLIGKLLDANTKAGVNLATVTNLRTKKFTKTNKEGLFFIEVAIGDSIALTSLTHEPVGVKHLEIKEEEVILYTKKLEKAIDLPELKVVSKREQQLKKEIESILAEPEARKNLSLQQAAALAQSPVTLLYEIFSKSAREDRKVAMLMQQKRRQELANYRFGVIAGQATDLRGEGLLQFRRFCDFSEEFLLVASDYEVTYEVLQLWNVYKKVKKKT